jgi:hypothetical protein
MTKTPLFSVPITDSPADSHSRVKLAQPKRTTRAAAKSLVDPVPNPPTLSEPQNSDTGKSSADSVQTSATREDVDRLSRKSPEPIPSASDGDSDDNSSPPHSLIDVSDDDSDLDEMTDASACHVQEKWNRPPSLTAGSGLSSILLESFFTAADNAFEQMNTPDADRTKTVANRILHPKITTWFAANRAEVNALEWSTYKKKVCSIALGADWDTKERRALELANQSSSETFSSFFDRVNLANTPLSITGKHFSQADLRALLTRCLNERFRTYMEPHLEDAAAVDDFYEWRNFMVKKQLLADAQYNSLLSAAREINANANASNGKRSHRSAFGDNPRGANTSKKPNSLSSSRSDTGSRKENTRAVPLTDSCRDIIKSNNGCNVCRYLFCTCKAWNGCQDFPRGARAALFQTPLSTADVDAARRGEGRCAPPAERSAQAQRTAAVSTSTSSASVTTLGSTDLDAATIAAIMYDNDTAVLSPDSSFGSMVSTSPVIAAVPAVPPSSSPSPPLTVPHITWDAVVSHHLSADPIHANVLIDNGSPPVLISASFAKKCALPLRRLHNPFPSAGIFDSSPRFSTSFVRLRLHDPNFLWSSRTTDAIVVEKLPWDIIAGLPFQVANKLVFDAADRTVVAKDSGFDLLHPPDPVSSPRNSRPHKKSLKSQYTKLMYNRKLLLAEIKHAIPPKPEHEHTSPPTNERWIAAVRSRVEELARRERLDKLALRILTKHQEVFTAIPPTHRLPDQICASIDLKGPLPSTPPRTYSCPKKYKAAWKGLIDEHLAAGRIRPSSSPYSSPSFVIPKADPTAAPRWVCDYRFINSHTVTDRFPLPHVDDILSDCAKGSIFSKLDMTNSFFHTRMTPDHIKYTAVTTPFGLYEWVVMPMGLRNAPPIHQRRMTTALSDYIGKFCHIYLDDIVIWSNSVEEHQTHVEMILTQLQEHCLHLNKKKCVLFQDEIEFLGHKISARGIEACSSKCEKILKWPRPKTARDVRSFLGIVRYIAVYLKDLAEHTAVLTPLTSKEYNESLPEWTQEHEYAFAAIKALVVSRKCLTVIDHDNPGDNRIFITTNASDRRTGGVLSWGPTWESSRPVAFDSMQLSPPQRNYPVHEKEMLAIVRALEKWRNEVLGCPVTVYTDHRTLEYFESQKHLSRRQARWQEFMSQFEIKIVYIKGEDNTVADALSRLPDDEMDPITDADDELLPNYEAWHASTSASILNISADAKFLNDIRLGYATDPFCQKMIGSKASFPSLTNVNDLWYVGDRLLVPKVTDVRESLFRLAHDSLGHFGAEKSYAALRDSYYWPGMRRDLERAYVPACIDCQRNKDNTKKPCGPLHPLPIPDARGESVAIDFIGPLPLDDGCNCIVTFTDRLGHADVRIVPTTTDITAQDFAVIFFDNWYCENGLPLNIVSDRDSKFTSAFWRAFCKLAGINQKMSTAFHPQTDGASERTNKTVEQCLRFHVERNQTGWKKKLPLVRFHIMNAVNASTGLSGFQVRMGRSPRILPPLVPCPTTPSIDEAAARVIVSDISSLEAEAKDALLASKVSQAHYANLHRSPEDVFSAGDKVLLKTLHRMREYKDDDKKRILKFIPRFDGPYEVTDAHAETSTYTVSMPNAPNTFPTFHSSVLRRFIPNDDALFPSRRHARPGPTFDNDGHPVYTLEKIIAQRKRGRSWQYLVKWVGYGDEENSWLPRRELDDCAALDDWFIAQGQLDKLDANVLERLSNESAANSAISASRHSAGSGSLAVGEADR